MPKYAQDFNKVIPTRKDHFEVMLVFGLFSLEKIKMICKKDNQIYFEAHDYNEVISIWEKIKAISGKNDLLFEIKINEWISDLPDKLD